MPISHRVETSTGTLLIRRWGHIRTHDEVQARRARIADPLVRPDIRVFVDTRDVEPPDSVETIRYLADCITEIAAELRCGPVAILVANHVQYGMARMYMALTEVAHSPTEVFRDEESALRWLEANSTVAS